MRETALRLTFRRPFAGMPGAQATARQGWRDRSGRCKPGVFTHRTVATARNRASGFGGDWRVRQQLPVGVGPDDRMPSGSREPKRAQQKTARNGDSVTEHHACSWHTAIHYLLTGKSGRQRRRRCPPRFRQAPACQGFSRGLTGGLHRLPCITCFCCPVRCSDRRGKPPADSPQNRRFHQQSARW